LAPLGSAEHRIAERFFAVVAPFATVQDDIALDDVQSRWRGEGDAPLLAAPGAGALLAPVLGASAVEELQLEDLLARLEETPGALAVVPFDELHPRFKVLTVDGVNLLDNRLDPERYPLAVALAVRGEAAPLLAYHLRGMVAPLTNRDPAQLTTLIMTG